MRQRQFVITVQANDLGGPSSPSIGNAVEAHLQSWGISARVAVSEIESAGGQWSASDGYHDRIRSTRGRCSCLFNRVVCPTHRAEIHRRLARVDAIREARGKDTAEVDLIMAVLRIDYGGDVVDEVAQECATLSAQIGA